MEIDMNKTEKLFAAIGGIADRHIDEYTAAMSKRSIARRRTARALKYLLPPLAACLCLAFLAYPIITLIFGGAKAEDPTWERTHAYISRDECESFLFSRLPGNVLGERAYLFYDDGGRDRRELWNTVEYTGAYANTCAGDDAIDYISVKAYTQNYFQGTCHGDIIAPMAEFDGDSPTLTVNGTAVKYCHTPAAEGNTDTASPSDYDELYQTFIKRGDAPADAALSAAFSIAYRYDRYTAGFEYDGVVYIVDLYSEGGLAAFEYYLEYMIPQNTTTADMDAA